MKKMLSLVLLFGLANLNLHAADYSLSDAKEKVVNSNINLSIAYENYVMVQTEARAKTLQLLPSLNADLLVTDYQYTILRSVIPEPQRFFEASAQKDLARAADSNRVIVKRNLLEDLEKTYFLFQFHKEMVTSFSYELGLKNEIAKRSKEAYDLGAIDFDEYYRVKRDVVSAQTQVVNGTELLKTEEYALKLILQMNTDEALNLAPIKFYNYALSYPKNSLDAASLAVNNSKEIDQFSDLISAAEKHKKGVSISWISWSGVGFDYFAKVSIAESEVEKLKLQKKKSTFEVKNQVALLYEQIAKHQEKMKYQDQLRMMAKADYDRIAKADNTQLTTFIGLKKAELALMEADRDSRKLEYEHEIMFIKLKRLLGANMITNVVPQA